MKHHEISTALLKYLKSIKPGFTIDSWIYNGVTDVKFGSPGGPWGDDVEGFLFVKQDNSYSFILRCVPNVTRKNGKLTSYIVIESMNLRSQLFNNDLDKGNTVRLEPGRSILLEPYDMTVGAPQKRQVTKEIFAQLNINTDQISVIDDQSPDWGKTLLDLLNWAVLREQVKIKLKKGFNKANMEELTENEMTIEFAELLQNASTWGQEFPEPIFDGFFDVIQARIVGQRHLKLVLRKPSGDLLIDAIAFYVDKPENWLGLRHIRAAYKLDINEFRGNRSVQFIVQYLEKIA